jgi:methyl-accepting chemotaxis protein
METTRDTIRESEQVIATLSQRVQQIGTILRVIDDVTDETALLALNGSIIAAQAGEQGRAFSVVADQLRSLASRVQEGTSEIDEVVRAIQTQTSNVARSVSQGFARAEAGAALIQNAQAALSTITTAARESTERMAESVRATAEQMETATAVAVQMQEVHAGVDRIRTVTREQAEATDAVERSAEELRAAAKEVQSTVALQTQGAARIGEGIEAVQQVVREITSGLEEQVESSQQLVTAVRGSARFTRAQEESASAIERAARELARQAELLRDAMRRFRV